MEFHGQTQLSTSSFLLRILCRNSFRKCLMASLFTLFVIGGSAPHAKAGAKTNLIPWEKDLKSAVLKAQKEEKPLLIRFEADWCTFCKKMEQDTFNNRKVATKIKSSFIPVVVNADKNPDVMKALGVKALPTTIILSHKLDILESIKGYKKSSLFQKIIAPYVIVEETEEEKKKAADELTAIKTKPKKNEIQWRNDLKTASLYAKKMHKPLLVQFETDWCAYCKKMKRETFTDATIIKQVNSTFVPVIINADSNPEIAKAVNVTSLPTTIVLSSELDTLKMIKGYKRARVLQGLLEEYTMDPVVVAKAKKALNNNSPPEPTATKQSSVAVKRSPVVVKKTLLEPVAKGNAYCCQKNTG